MIRFVLRFDFFTNNLQVASLIRKSDKERSKKARATAKDEAGGSLRLCKVCQINKDTKRCTGCYMVWYCGQKCQQENWSDHKEKCKTNKKQYRDVILIEEKTVLQPQFKEVLCQ